MNVFHGDTSILDYFNPDNLPPTPLVEIPLHPFKDDNVRIFAKLMQCLPMANVKSLPAYNMLLHSNLNHNNQAIDLSKIDTLIENSSGNTVFSLSIIGKLLGINNTKAIVSNEISPAKLKQLQFFDVNCIINDEPICPNPNDLNSGINIAKKLSSKHENYLNLNQYENDLNPSAHYKWTAPQIVRQLESLNLDLNLFACGLGTSGSLVGTSTYLKSCYNKLNNSNKNETKDPLFKTIGVVRLPNNPVPGPRTLNLLDSIKFNWNESCDSIQQIGTKDSYKHSLELCRKGILVGPSSGFTYKGLLNYLNEIKGNGQLKELQNLLKQDNKTVNCVFICCDQPFVYIDEYFKYLGKENFPKIENEYLLQKKQNLPIEMINRINDILADKKINLKPIDAYKIIYNKHKKCVNDDIIIFDIRDNKNFKELHILNSINIDIDNGNTNNPLIDTNVLQTEYNSLKLILQEFMQNNDLQGKKIFNICYSGNSSVISTTILIDNGIENVYNISGGFIEWSKENLPRWKSDNCILLTNTK
ncbi:tryptophan synthase beta subunit-like PLP-dependent enzyme [Ascoidea rubescens DSM 1968]|uniref:Tryptophan synthase beta subunit-like PLP-dependent enzyme n=1 Tax=Ascoidea rubescens DSM 1968 TaxID=1344418 RepID=A0A1D2VD90_9ASCO|nr:tryptophan synthase beta subunit-like PLP-dependent enzyme [Ascoidea rubescens DSM 1968]ODV59668.1 tryptophan synthase beta subunit-like PLP-dependent enzyme [Ascoidea rubescens DSM 1968]